MNNQIRIEMEYMQGHGRNGLNRRDGTNRCLKDCPPALQRKFHAVREGIKQQQMGPLTDFIKEGKRCAILHPLNVTEEVVNDRRLPPHRMTLLAYAILYDNLAACVTLMHEGANFLQFDNNEAGSPLFQVMAHCHTIKMSCCHDHHLAILEAHQNPSSTCGGCWHSDAVEHNHDEVIGDCCNDHGEMKDCCRQHKISPAQCTCYDQLQGNIIGKSIDVFCAKIFRIPCDEITKRHYERHTDLHLATRGGSYPYNICYMAFCLRKEEEVKLLIYVGADFLELNSKDLPSYLREYCTSSNPKYLSWLFNNLSTSNLNKLIQHIIREHSEQLKRRLEINRMDVSLLSDREMVILPDGCNLLEKVDKKQRTALHIAAELGQEEGVITILKMGGDATKRDGNQDTPLMIAVKNKHDGVAKLIIRHLMSQFQTGDYQGVSRDLESFLSKILEGITTNAQMVKEVVSQALPIALKSGNRIAVQTIVCNYGVDPTKDLISCAIRSRNLDMIKLLDSLWVENSSYNRITAFQEACFHEFTAGKNFYYDKLSIKQRQTALYLTCVRGTSAELDFLITKGVDPDSCQCGESELKQCPLLVAASEGRVMPVVQLLTAKARPSVVDDREYNCLMIAIERKDKVVVKAILETLQQKGFENDLKEVFLQRAVKVSSFGLTVTYTTPLRMLIKCMPEMAKQFLDSCIEEISVGKYKVDFGYINDIDDESSLPKEVSTVLHKRGHILDNHVVSCMIENNRSELLEHIVVSEWIKMKWKWASFFYIVMVLVYCTLLATLTAFALLSPRPAGNIGCINATEAIGNSTFECLNAFGNMTDDNSETRKMYATGGITIIISTLHLIVELIQMYLLRVYYFKDLQNYLQLFVFVGAIVFVSAQFDAGINHCWCTSELIWQLGAAVVMGCWCNFIVLLKDYPFHKIGGHTTLLFKICVRYLKLVYLPLLLTASFAFPFYMLFAVTAGHSLRAFSTPWWALGSTFFDTKGFDDIFIDTSVAYPAMGMVLFTIYFVIVTILFTNMLIGLSTSDAIENLKKANIISVGNQVKFILFIESIAVCLKRNKFTDVVKSSSYVLKEVNEDFATKADVANLKDLIATQGIKLQNVLSNQEALLCKQEALLKEMRCIMKQEQR